MSVTTLLMVSMIGASAVSSEAIRWFPGDYFDSRVKSVFQSEVMESWPGPSQLMALWREGGLDEPAQVSLLLGGAVFHDPVLLAGLPRGGASASRRGFARQLFTGTGSARRTVCRMSAGVSAMGTRHTWAKRWTG